MARTWLTQAECGRSERREDAALDFQLIGGMKGVRRTVHCTQREKPACFSRRAPAKIKSVCASCARVCVSQRQSAHKKIVNTG